MLRRRGSFREPASTQAKDTAQAKLSNKSEPSRASQAPVGRQKQQVGQGLERAMFFEVDRKHDVRPRHAGPYHKESRRVNARNFRKENGVKGV